MTEYERFLPPPLQVHAGPITTRLIDTICKLNRDEMRVLLEIAERLLHGQRQYGPLELARDRRDWKREAHEEFLDAAVYLAIRTTTQRGLREKGDEHSDASDAGSGRDV